MKKKVNQFDAKKLKRLRMSKGLTWMELSKELKAYEPKISKNSIWQWERGQHEPSARYLSALSNYFGVSINDFMRV